MCRWFPQRVFRPLGSFDEAKTATARKPVVFLAVTACLSVPLLHVEWAVSENAIENRFWESGAFVGERGPDLPSVVPTILPNREGHGSSMCWAFSQDEAQRAMTDDLPDYRTRAALRDDLTRIGLRAGDTVMVHAAMSKVGPLLNGPDALSNAILDVVGPDGTLVVYTSWDSVHDDLLDDDGRVLPEWRDHVPGFDRQVSRAVRMNGIIAEFVRTMPGARRSGNPGASVAAIGRQAEWITVDHPQDYGFGEGSPLAKLVELNGRVLMVGAPWDTMTLVHHADHLADLPDKAVLRYEVPFATAEGTAWRFMEEFDTTEPVIAGLPDNYIEQIVTAYVASGSGHEGSIGLAPSLLVDAKPMLAFAIQWLEGQAALLGSE